MVIRLFVIAIHLEIKGVIRYGRELNDTDFSCVYISDVFVHCSFIKVNREGGFTRWFESSVFCDENASCINFIFLILISTVSFL